MERRTDYDWQGARRSGIAAIGASSIVAAAIWFGVVYLAPPLEGMEPVGARMIFALKCCCGRAVLLRIGGGSRGP